MPKIKLTYVDKDNWENEIDFCYIKNNLTIDDTHEYVNMKNVLNLDDDQSYITLCSKSKLLTTIQNKQHKENCLLIDFDITLDYIFENLVSLAKEKDMDIYVLNKSLQPIRSNVSMTIDLDTYDTDKEFNEVKDILEKQLEDSIKNAKKSNNPKSAEDLGITVKEETDSVFAHLIKNILNDGSDLNFIENFVEVQEYISEEENEDDEDFENVETLIHYDMNNKFSISILDEEVIISKDDKAIDLTKQQAKKLIKMLEVMINE